MFYPQAFYGHEEALNVLMDAVDNLDIKDDKGTVPSLHLVAYNPWHNSNQVVKYVIVS